MSSIFASTICLLLLTLQYAGAESFISQSVATGQFGLLNATMVQYNVASLLALLGGSKITIFGPTDAALTAAGITDPSSLSEPVLLRHGVVGQYTAATIATKACHDLTSLSQTSLTVMTAADGSITVNGVAVNATYADIVGDEGVFHGINGIIPASYPACPTEAPAPTDAPTNDEGAADESAATMVAMMAGSIMFLSTFVCSCFLL
ncbi:unnamed protein product [Cylindrotheca closterium]|uniref:FAS1 domain-containing protein n=1 Tax=Cylindrotheca closterium TaxID=2856 RepID=A0AAD2CN57_9STRA|nr:unnamed protein product [Cylindrotheca closterium]